MSGNTWAPGLRQSAARGPPASRAEPAGQPSRCHNANLHSRFQRPSVLPQSTPSLVMFTGPTIEGIRPGRRHRGVLDVNRGLRHAPVPSTPVRQAPGDPAGGVAKNNFVRSPPFRGIEPGFLPAARRSEVVPPNLEGVTAPDPNPTLSVSIRQAGAVVPDGRVAVSVSWSARAPLVPCDPNPWKPAFCRWPPASPNLRRNGSTHRPLDQRHRGVASLHGLPFPIFAVGLKWLVFLRLPPPPLEQLVRAPSSSRAASVHIKMPLSVFDWLIFHVSFRPF